MKIVFTVVLIITSIICSNSVNGCMCPEINNDLGSKEFDREMNYEFNKATAVFIGEVIELDRFKLKLKVTQSWKGVKTHEISMITGASLNKSNNTITSTSCDYHFMKGEIYLIYAFGVFNELKTHNCSRTRFIKDAQNDIFLLNSNFQLIELTDLAN